jgi:hypothetical protein
MHFILISKKKSFQDEQMNTSLLNSPCAPSLISREVIKYQISNFILYIYPYDQIDHEVSGYSYDKDDDMLLLCNGIVNTGDSPRNRDIRKLFQEIESTELIGDYQLISLDKNGNGFIKTPSISIRQLFYYEDENCTVLSTEIKLIVDGIKKFREKKFVDHFDQEFIEDTLLREWKERNFPRNTIFKEVKRIYPHDIKYFREGNIIIENQESIEVPDWFKKAFYEDRDKLFDDYYKILTNFVETNLILLKGNINKIIMGMTGGADSRVSVAILSKICKKHQIPLICYTGGQATHPDVVIAKNVAKALDLPHFHHYPMNNRSPNSRGLNDYLKTFYLAQGDWNSKDFVDYYERKISSRLSPLEKGEIPPAIGAYPMDESTLYQLGMDAFKKLDLSEILRTNRWYARRILFNQNFFFPLFNTDYEIWFGLLYGEMGRDVYKEFIYEILLRTEPKLLKIPLAGDTIPQVNVKEYSTYRHSKHHEREPFLWDYHLVMENLNHLLEIKYNQLDEKSILILKLVGLNEFDYFINTQIQNNISSNQRKQISLKECFKSLLKERFSNNYPKNKSSIRMPIEGMSLIEYNTKEYYLSRMQILMEYASVANKRSFEEIEPIIFPSTPD